MTPKKYYSYESLGTDLTAFSFVFGAIYGVASLLIFGKIVEMSTSDWGFFHFIVCIFLSGLVSTAVYHNIWIRQSLLPAVIAGGIYSYFNFDGSDLKLYLNLCVLTVVNRVWIGIFEARATTGKITDFWRSFLFHPTDWASEFNMSQSLNSDLTTKNKIDERHFKRAVKKVNIEKVKQILHENQVDVDAKYDKDMTSLFWASSKGYLDLLKILLENGADVNAKTICSETPLMAASDQGYLEIVQELLNNGADANIQSSDRVTTALMQAASNGYDEIVKLLIENGADVNVKCLAGFTVLMEASQEGHIAVVKQLLDAGAQVNADNEEMDTALSMAKKRGYDNIERVLKEAGGKNLDLLKATANHYILKISKLIDDGADIDMKNNSGETALIIASRADFVKIIKILIDRGAVVNLKNRHGDSALNVACQSGAMAATEMLINSGADVNTKNSDGMTPLFYVSNCNIVKMLIKKGADVNAKTNFGWTILHKASSDGLEEVAALLKKYGAKE